MRFSAIVYDADGRITVLKRHTTALALEGLNYIQGDIDGNIDDFYVVDGALVEKGARPSQAHEFDYSAGAWVFSLAVGKEQKWQEMKEARHTAEFSEFSWSSYTFQCDAQSQMRIQSAVNAANMDAALSMVWTLSDNTTHTFTADEIKQIGQALSSHVSQCHERGRIVRQQITDATTQTELEAIVW